MTDIFQRLGFKYTTLGAPLTDAQIATNHRIFLCCTLGSGLGGVAGLLAILSIGRLSGAGSAPEITPLGYLIAFAVFGSLLISLVSDLALNAPSHPDPIEGQSCLDIKAAADQYPEVRQHIDAIREQARPIRRCDEYLIRKWLKEAETRNWQREADRACRALHGIPD